MDSMEVYTGREATKIKHMVLSRYLERLTFTVGTFCATLNYIEGFAGPWQSRADSLSDTSPHVAIAELRKAREGIKKYPKLRCLFVEKGKEAADTLRGSLQQYDDVETVVLQGEFENKVNDILAFARDKSAPAPRFTFLFVEPTGWTGFNPAVIAPLLRLEKSEVLVNFMTKDIIRHIDDSREHIRRSFDPLFGSLQARGDWEGLAGRQREEAIVGAFCRRLKEVGGFRHVVTAIVLHPWKKRIHFHLVYGTRSDAGLREFRKAERSTLRLQGRLREQAQLRTRVERTRQEELFGAGEVESRSDLEELREQYHERARGELDALLQQRGRMSFDDLEMVALQHPMTATADLKIWLQEWHSDHRIRFEGLSPRGRVPKHGEGHFIVWIEGDSGHREQR
jgi:three-Cys-motif partner protein